MYYILWIFRETLFFQLNQKVKFLYLKSTNFVNKSSKNGKKIGCVNTLHYVRVIIVSNLWLTRSLTHPSLVP